jgi:hypothetical protein
MNKSPEQNRLIKVRQILASRFDENELRTLCFDLGMDYESLPGSGKTDKARELVAYCERHNCIPELTRIGKQQRPDIDWEDITETIASPPRESKVSGEFFESPQQHVDSRPVLNLSFVAAILIILVLVGIVSLIIDIAAPSGPRIVTVEVPIERIVPAEVTVEITQVPMLWFRVVTATAKVYTDPDATSQVIESIAQGQEVEVLDADEDWMLVAYVIGSVRTTGWMPRADLEIVR